MRIGSSLALRSRSWLIVDETGLTGSFAWQVTFLPAEISAGRGPTYPGICTAVKEDLALALEPIEAELDVMVIDAVSLPEPN